MGPADQQDERSDEELVAAANVGDPSAFEALYHRHRDWTASLAYRFTGNRDDALDILQDTFIYVLGKFPGFVLTSKFTTFLYPVVRNLAITRRRKARGRLIGADQLVDAEAPTEPTDPRQQLAAALARLPQPQREVVLMRFADGLSLREIATALQIPIGTAKSRLHNALSALRRDERTRKLLEP